MNGPLPLSISQQAVLEVSNLADGVFAPLTGFMDAKDYHSVVNNLHLDDGTPFPIPVTLDLPEDMAAQALRRGQLELRNADGEALAEMDVEDVFRIQPEHDLPRLFSTTDSQHPGVAYELARSPFRVGGAIRPTSRPERLYPQLSLRPAETKALFKARGWQTVVGFQTRNPIHRAHEYLQRIALELADGLFIQPLLGWKKADDFAPEAVIAAYRIMVDQIYPKDRAFLGTLLTPMRYAGPREAVFHAVIRKNYGCTHFIVGRDHAGVGQYYGKYDAHKLCRSFNDLGIEILTLAGPYYCERCATIVTERTCPHGDTFALDVSGTDMRRLLRSGTRPPEEYMRPEVADALIALSKKNALFVGDLP